MMLVKFITTFLVISSLMACKSNNDLPTVINLELEKYMGKWYEIARFPHRFEKDLKCVTAEYSLLENGKVKVINRGHLTENSDKVKSVEGSANMPDKNFPGRLKVTFFWPFYGNYYVVELDENYQYALVGAPSRNYLWILSRNSFLESSTYDMLIVSAQKNGFDISKLEKVPHDCN
jgi:lipocalin